MKFILPNLFNNKKDNKSNKTNDKIRLIKHKYYHIIIKFLYPLSSSQKQPQNPAKYFPQNAEKYPKPTTNAY